MIRANEIRETAREHGVPETTIEKDYCIGWILNGRYQSNNFIALKGGTGIRKLYISNYRFSEDLDFTILKNMGKAEKIRSIFERTRPRDFYDLWFFTENFDIRQALKILPEKCEFKAVKTDIKSVMERKDDFSSAWENSLFHQLKDLPDFDLVFYQVLEQLEMMDSM